MTEQLRLEEYIVSLKDANDLDQFYLDMEYLQTHNPNIPSREVECVERRSISRNTNYLLTIDEVEQIKADPRVLSVSIPMHRLPVVDVLLGTTQTSTNWDRSSNSPVSSSRNWGIYRTSLETNVSNWGRDGTTTVSGTVTLDTTGKNVDVVIVDGCINTTHQEYASRFVNYNWFQHDAELGITFNTTSTYMYDAPSEVGGHGTETASFAVGTRCGFAKDANLYNLRYTDYTFRSYLFDYIRMFHKNKGINPVTGFKNPTVVNNSWTYATNGVSNWLYNVRSVTYRGTTITPTSLGNTASAQGVSGVCSDTAIISAFSSLAPSSGNRITTSGTSSASVSSISFVERGVVGMTSITDPTTGSNTGGNFKITLPFNITYLGTTYTDIYINVHGIVAFGTSPSDYFSALGFRTGDSPAVPKIMVGAETLNNTDRIWYGVSGSTGSRTYTIRVEQTYDSLPRSLYTNVGFSDIKWEITFYEATPTQIDLHMITNAQYVARFTASQLTNYGIYEPTAGASYYQVQDESLDLDMADAMADGIIFVNAAGNDTHKMDLPGGTDYDNSLVCPSLFYTYNPFYYCRGGSPGHATGVINVGALASSKNEPKSDFSNCGSRVDLFAPGEDVIGAYYSGNTIYSKTAGTSFASPTVLGVLACALERNPHWNATQAGQYIKSVAKSGVMRDTGGSYTDNTALKGAPNSVLYYKQERPSSGHVYPRETQSTRPSTGQVYPRSRIVRYGR